MRVQIQLGIIFPTLEKGGSGDLNWWALAELNCGHEAFQASALPTELRALGIYAENGSSAASGQ